MELPSLKSLFLFGLAAFSSSVIASPSPPDYASSSLDRRAKSKPKTPKYFTEPGGSLELGHYDKRYFKDKVPYEEHRFVLRDLIRSYLTTLQKVGAETWLAHGTLLGWWWNGQIMPWDYDLDVQVNNNTLTWLGHNMNRTEHTHTFTDDKGVPTNKTYLLDINPHHEMIDRGDGMNIIDARWIDMSNGMFIDITGVRERQVDRPGSWSCRNNHRYDSQDLWPMRVTEFEGVKARIPYSFERILSAEYGAKSLVTEEFSGHRWDREAKQWMKMTPEEEKKRKEETEARKKKEMEKEKEDKA